MSRNRHIREDLHFGTMAATLVELEEALGPLPEGMTVEQALRYLWDRVTLFEEGALQRSAFSLNAVILDTVFWLDAVIRGHPFWADDFERTESGPGSSTGTSLLGSFPWREGSLFGATLATDTLDGQSALVATPSSTFMIAAIAGAPRITRGQAYVDFYIPDNRSYIYRLGFQRPDLSGAQFIIQRFGGAAYNYLITTGSGNELVVLGPGWWTLKSDLVLSGEPLKWAVWQAGTPEGEATLRDGTNIYGPGDLTPAAPFYDVQFFASGSGIAAMAIDNIRVYKTDEDPWRWYNEFSLDAWIVEVPAYSFTLDALLRRTQAGSLSLNAIARAAQAGSVTLDAYIMGGGTGTLVLDAILLAPRTGSATLDAMILSEDPYYDSTGLYDDSNTYD
jgi:hypothetical protein